MARTDVSALRRTAQTAVERAGYRLVRLERREEVLEVQIQASRPPPAGFARALAAELRAASGAPTRVRVVTLLATEATAP